MGMKKIKWVFFKQVIQDTAIQSPWEFPPILPVEMIYNICIPSSPSPVTPLPPNRYPEKERKVRGR